MLAASCPTRWSVRFQKIAPQLLRGILADARNLSQTGRRNVRRQSGRGARRSRARNSRGSNEAQARHHGRLPPCVRFIRLRARIPKLASARLGDDMDIVRSLAKDVGQRVQRPVQMRRRK